LLRTIGVLIVMASVAAGCAPHAALDNADGAVESRYKTAPDPPQGYARVYILPIGLTTFWGGHSELAGDIFLGSDKSDQVFVGGVSPGRFLAFDLPEGSYYLSAVPWAVASTPSAETFLLHAGTVLFLRPRSYGTSGAEGLLGFLILPARQPDDPQFEGLDAAAGISDIQPMRMAAISPAATRAEGVKQHD